MPVSIPSQVGGEQNMATALTDDIMSNLRVALPGIIQSFDPETVTCVVQPAVKGYESDDAGKKSSLSLPLLVDIPVIFPRGGGVTLTFPVKAGDECLLVFADRCIDFWWQNGGIQEPVDGRMHDLSDAFAIVGPQSQAQKISGISTRAAQLRTDDGAAFIELDPGSHAVSITTPGKLTASAQGGTEINSPEIVLNGNVTINGNLSQGMGDGGGTATMLGPVNVTNDVKAGGISLQTHKHGGVETGGGQTGGPQ
ncbi:Gp138 family membrane-puncturing spike protein [Serratia marcescens]|uniref:Gp138 family membrane-puncturing spike protein n=1 Tax=Serratia marcescens TaxID=615 RepID=UPI000745256B|nr:Gp138 family membrane-puncturing spike protein [Serratia marcescens]EME1466495.1 translation initiation factor IF-2 [Serratia marcescens]MDP8622223.1 Gp138 family membrane-puncturing spike protein [Serratia marcescens]TWY30449.1 translation initiation factor IF-2 [Serratia marcescens]CVA06125.1 Phage P2 baseplate assembly protein gpV [Serratia marcescens]CVD62495.1 Phage P2 baseplate assembly protein gpV [Serratia marcescens]